MVATAPESGIISCICCIVALHSMTWQAMPPLSRAKKIAAANDEQRLRPISLSLTVIAQPEHVQTY